MRQVLGVLLGAIGGGLLGYSQWICPGGQCMLTGSWVGGALLGGVMGLLVVDAVAPSRPRASDKHFPADADQRPSEPD